MVAVSFDPKDTAETGGRQEANLPADAMAAPNTANGWHFLTGDAGQHQGAHRRRGLPLQIRPEDRPVRARQRHHDPDARGHASRAISTAWNTRRAIFAWAWWKRPANKIGTPGGPDSAVLLPLRPGHRQVRRPRHEYGAARRRRLRAGVRRVSVDCACAAKHAAAQFVSDWMSDHETTSISGTGVHHRTRGGPPALFLLGRRGVLHGADFRRDLLLRHPLPAALGARIAATGARRHGARDCLVGDSLRPHHGHVHLGRKHLLHRRAVRPTTPCPSTWWASSGCGRSQHMEGQREINELHIPVGRAGQAHHDLAKT